MSIAFWIIYVIVIIAVPVVFFVLGYYLIKKPLKMEFWKPTKRSTRISSK